jgi:hypothetical protein
MSCDDGDVADSDALRAQRYRQHKTGDHSLCRHGRPVLRSPDSSPIRQDLAEFDPEAELRMLAGRLAAACAQDPANAALARELRATLLALPVAEEYVPDVIDMLNAREARQRDSEIADLFRELRD